MYGNRTHWELCSNPPLVLKTRAPTRGANTPKVERSYCTTSMGAGKEPGRQVAPESGPRLVTACLHIVDRRFL